MRSLRWVGLVFSLLIVGVLGGLMAPLGAEAGTPTLTLDGTSIALELESLAGGDNCPPASTHKYYNGTGNNNNPLVVDPVTGVSSNGLSGCWSITALKANGSSITVGQWILSNYSDSNKGKVYVNDGVGGDSMKVTGMTLSPLNPTTGNSTVAQMTSSTLPAPDGTPCTGPTPPGPCRVGVLTLTNVFNALGGQNTAGTYNWGMSVGGAIDITGENAINDRFHIIGTGCEATGCTVPTRTGGTGAGGRTVGQGTFLKVGGATIAVPEVERVQTSGATAGKLGIVSSISTSIDPLITANNGLPTMDIPCDSGSGKCTPTLRMDYIWWVQGTDKVKLSSSVLSCAGTCNPIEAVTSPKQKIILKCGPPEEPGTLAHYCARQNKDSFDGEIANCPGCEPPEMCEGTCIFITMTGTPAGQSVNKEFTFGDVTGHGVGPFQFQLDSNGYDQHTFSNLTPDLVVLPNPLVDRFFEITTYPENKNGVPYQTDQIVCTSQLNLRLGQQITRWEVGFGGTNSSAKLNLTVFTLGEGDLLSCNWHVH